MIKYKSIAGGVVVIDLMSKSILYEKFTHITAIIVKNISYSSGRNQKIYVDFKEVQFLVYSDGINDDEVVDKAISTCMEYEYYTSSNISVDDQRKIDTNMMLLNCETIKRKFINLLALSNEINVPEELLRTKQTGQ